MLCHLRAVAMQTWAVEHFQTILEMPDTRDMLCARFEEARHGRSNPVMRVMYVRWQLVSVRQGRRGRAADVGRQKGAK